MDPKGPYLVAGLGNPGKMYRNTRHNLGFMVLDALASRFDASFKRKWRISSHYSRINYDGHDVVLMKPRTFMNRSGLALLSAQLSFGLDPSRMMVVVDDVNLPFGTIRLRKKGSDGGHNGLASVIGALGSAEFPRCRIGIGGSDIEELVDYVLEEFSADEKAQLGDVVEHAANAVLSWVKEGIDGAMNRFNGENGM